MPVCVSTCRQNQNTHFMFRNFFFFENHAVYEVIWRNVVEPETDGNIIRRMRFACWITESTDTHSEYVRLLAFILQQWLRERASILLYASLPVILKVLVNSDSTFAKEGVSFSKWSVHSTCWRTRSYGCVILIATFNIQCMYFLSKGCQKMNETNGE